MGQIIFARPRWNYDSYSDLYQLIALSGYPLIYFDEIDPQSDNCYILTTINGENMGGWENPKARFLWLDLEWRLEGEYPHIPGVSGIIACDRWYVEQVKKRTETPVQYMTLGSHAGLDVESGVSYPKQYDCIMLAYMPPRRSTIYDYLKMAGVTIAENGWGEDRHYKLKRTQVMVHVHQHDNVATVAPQRWALAAAYHLPIIAEEVTVETLPAWYMPYTALVTATREFTREDKHAAAMQALALELHQYLCVEHTFRLGIEQAV